MPYITNKHKLRNDDFIFIVCVIINMQNSNIIFIINSIFHIIVYIFITFNLFVFVQIIRKPIEGLSIM